MNRGEPLKRILLVPLTIWMTLFVEGSCYPVLYPSLSTTGFAFIDNADKEVVSIPASIDALLCRVRGQTQSLDLLNRDCSDVVIFTSTSFITLRVLNLSSNGVVQSIQSIPQVSLSSVGVLYSWTAFGASGQMNLESIGDSTMDLQTRNPVPESEEEEVDFLDAYAEGKDLPESLTSTEIDAIENNVIIANSTSGFLDANGSIRQDLSFVLELRLDSLPEQQLFHVTLDFGDEGRRSLMIYLDSTPATASIQLHSENERRRRDVYTFEIEFSKYMLNLPNADSVVCPKVAEPLNVISSQYLTGSDPNLVANDLMAVILATRELPDCNTRLDTLAPEALVEVSGVDASIEAETRQISVRKLRGGRGISPTVVMATFSVKEDRRKRVRISIKSSSGVTLSGAPINQQVETYSVGRNSRQTEDSVKTSDQFGTTSTAVISSTVAASVTTSVGVSMAASISGTTATSGASVGGSMSGTIDMIHFGQKIYLITKLSVDNFPENFAAYGQSLSWTMMDIRTPWNEDNKNEEEQEAEEQGVQKLTNDDGYERVIRAFSWSGLFFICLVVLHVMLISIFFRYKLSLPSALRLPRLELYFFYWCIPAIAGASASLFTGNENQRTLGIILLMMIPLPFVFWHVYIIVKYFLVKRPENLKVIYELNNQPQKKLLGSSQQSGAEIKEKKEEQIAEALNRETGNSLLEKHVLSVALGPPYRIGTWKTTDGPVNKFVDRYGPMFEDYRGLPGLRRNPTFGITCEGQKIDRGTFTPVNPHLRYAIDRSQLSHVFKVSGTLFQLIRIIFISCFILGAENPTSNSQTATLFTLSAVYLILLRIFRPYCSRLKLALAMVTEILDICTYIIVFYLINSDRSEEEDIRRNLGIAMLCFEGFGFVLIFVDQGVSILTTIKDAVVTIWKSQGDPPKIVDVFQKAQLQNTRYLMLKYTRIWIAKTLGKGLYSGVIKKDKGAPFEEMFWVSPGLAIRKKLLPTLYTTTKDCDVTPVADTQ
eukprot:g2391.t1